MLLYVFVVCVCVVCVYVVFVGGVFVWCGVVFFSLSLWGVVWVWCVCGICLCV